MTLLLTSGSNHTIHIFVEHTAPHRRGGANQNDHRPSTGGGGGDEDKQDQTGKATRPNKTTTHLTGKGGYHGVGGGGGVWQPCIIYTARLRLSATEFSPSLREDGGWDHHKGVENALAGKFESLSEAIAMTRDRFVARSTPGSASTSCDCANYQR